MANLTGLLVKLLVELKRFSVQLFKIVNVFKHKLNRVKFEVFVVEIAGHLFIEDFQDNQLIDKIARS